MQLVLCSLAALCATAGAAEESSRESADGPQWAVVSSHGVEGEIVEAWLTIPHPETGVSRAVATLVTPSGVNVWWSPDGSCHSVPRPRLVELRGRTGSSSRACALAGGEPFRFVAVIHYPDLESTAVATSDSVEPKPGWEVPGWVLAMLGVIGGWIVGILTPTIQRAIDQWFALRDDRVALLTYVARDVLPSLRTMDAQLDDYLRNGAPDEWSISEALYLDMALPDAPVHRILPPDQRESYLGPFRTLHEQIVTFNREHGFHHDEQARMAAKRARRSIDALLGHAGRDLPEPPEESA